MIRNILILLSPIIGAGISGLPMALAHADILAESSSIAKSVNYDAIKMSMKSTDWSL